MSAALRVLHPQDSLAVRGRRAAAGGARPGAAKGQAGTGRRQGGAGRPGGGVNGGGWRGAAREPGCGAGAGGRRGSWQVLETQARTFATPGKKIMRCVTVFARLQVGDGHTQESTHAGAGEWARSLGPFSLGPRPFLGLKWAGARVRCSGGSDS